MHLISNLHLSIALLGLAALQAPAAPITWAVHNITNDVKNVSTDGTLVSARNGSIKSAATVNGVTFETVDKSGNLFDSLFNNDQIGYGGFGKPTVVTDVGYMSFLQQGQRSGRRGYGTLPQIAPSKEWATVNFTDLKVGNIYQVQIWASDSRNRIPGQRGLLLGNGAVGDPVLGKDAMLLHETSEGGVGQYAIGTFTADATTQSFNVRGYDKLTTTPLANPSDHFSNGWQLRDLGPGGPDTTIPSPNPMTWARVPEAAGDRSITMTATSATDQSGVEYQFARYSADGKTLIFTSPWQDSPAYTDTGLDPATTYSYRVTARDKAAKPNVCAPSTPPASATTEAEVVIGQVNAGHSTVVASRSRVPADGNGTATVTVTLRDGKRLPIPGEGVTLAGNPAKAAISPSGSQKTNAAGQAVFTVKSSAVGTVQFTATSAKGSVVLSPSAEVEFVEPAAVTEGGNPILIAGWDGTSDIPKDSAIVSGLVPVTLTNSAGDLTNGPGKTPSALWGKADLDVDAADSPKASNGAVMSSPAAFTLTLKVTNNGTLDLKLDKIHFITWRDGATAPTSATIAYTAGNLGAPRRATQATVSLGTGIGIAVAHDVAISDFLADTTLSEGESATFTWTAAEFGGESLSLDNFAISGKVIH